MTLRRRLVIALACLALVLATEAVLTFQLNRAVERDVVETLGNALVASDGAVERALALAWVQAQTQELATESYRRAYLGSAPSQDDDLSVASAGLTRGFDRLEASLAIQGVGEPVNDADTLQRDLRREFEALRGLTDHLLALAPLRPEEAHAHLDERIEPQVNHRLGPLIENRRLETERVLRERARRIADRTQSSARLVIVINLITILLALGVVLSLLRSTGKRVEQLVEAAAAVGQGRLDTRIAITSHDDLGFLASTLNQMAEDLARTTVSRSDLHNILESMPDALLILNAQLEVTRANEAALELLGYEPTELHGRAFPQLVSAAALAGPAMADLPPGQRLVTEAHLSSRDERETVAMVSVSALRTPSGSPDRYVCVAHDITERMKAEVRLRTLLADKDTLLRELHHRVKNNLQVVSSLLDLQSASQTSPELRLLLGESRNRIRCMALIHDQLCRTVTSGLVNLRSYLGELTRALAWSRGETSERIAIEAEVAEVTLGLDQAVATGLIVNELVSNSLKHAFDPAAPGRIMLRLWPTEAGDALILEVADDGCGFPSGAERTDGSLGLTLVEALVRQLRGTLAIDGTRGTTTRITFPPSPEVSAHAA